MDIYPVVSVITGKIVATTNQWHNAESLARAINRHAGSDVAALGLPVPHNPRYAGDPSVLAAFVNAATQA